MILQERFDEKWTPEPFTGCWLWTSCVNRKGYGRFSVGGRTGSARIAHRVSWELYQGSIPKGMHVLHKCDTPECVNPDHLYIGINNDNVKDAIDRGHYARKLTPDQVRLIRYSSTHRGKLAKQFGVSIALIYMIRNRKAWRHVQ